MPANAEMKWGVVACEALFPTTIVDASSDHGSVKCLKGPGKRNEE